MTKNGKQSLAEIIEIQFAKLNYDWHYNLADIHSSLTTLKYLNYTNHLVNKMDYSGKLTGKLNEKMANAVSP